MYLKTSYYKYPPDDFFITKKKVEFIWIHFHTVISKPQSKSFYHTLNYSVESAESAKSTKSVESAESVKSVASAEFVSASAESAF